MIRRTIINFCDFCTALPRACALFMICLFINNPNAVFGANFESESENALFEYFETQCKSVEIFPNAFPDYYMGRKQLNYCDIASVFDPEQYSFFYQFLKVANFNTTSVIKEYDAATEIFADHYGWRKEDAPGRLERALVGDVVAYYELVSEKEISPLFGKSGLSNDQVKDLSRYFDPVVSELLFLNQGDFNARLNQQRLIDYANHLIIHSPHISIEQLLHSTWRLNDALYEVFKPDLEVPSALALNIPHKLRLKILSLASISSGFDAELINSIRLLEYSPDEVFGHFTIGTDDRFYETSTQFFDEYFLKCSRSLITSLDGALAIDSPLDSIACLQELLEINPDLFWKYTAIKDSDLITEAVQINVDEFFSWVDGSEVLAASKTLFERIFIAEIRYSSVSIDPERRSNASLMKQKLPGLSKRYESFDSHLLQIAYQLQIWESTKSELQIAWVKKKLKSLFLQDDICINISPTVCHQNIRYILHELSDFGFVGELKYSFSKNMKDLVSSAREDFAATSALELYNCDVEPWKKQLVNAAFEAGAFDANILRWCSSDDLLNLANKKPDTIELQEIIVSTGAFPNSAAIDYLTNPNLWNNESLGLLFVHIHNATPRREIIKFPDNGVGIYAKSLPPYQWLLTRDDVEQFFFKEFEASYWNEIKPTNSIANFLLSKGKYELAYLSQRQFVSKQLMEKNDPLTKVTFPISLYRLKYLAQQASIPDKFISEEVGGYYASFYSETAERGSTAGLFSTFKDVAKSGFDFGDGAQRVVSKQLDFIKSLFSETDSDDQRAGLRTAFNMTNSQIMMLCDDVEQLNLAVELAQSYVGMNNDLLLRIGADETLTYEFFRYLSMCMISRDTVLNFDSLITQYILPSLLNGTDLFDPNLLPIIMLLSDFSENANSQLGAYTALVFSKHYFGDLADIFVGGNSDSLRTKQAAFELIHTNIARTFKKYDAEKYPQVQSERLAYQLHKLSLSFHFPILTYSTMDRFIDEFSTVYKISKDEVRSDVELYHDLKRHYKDVDLKVSAAENPTQLALAKAAYSKTNISISPNVLAVGDKFEQFIGAEKINQNVVFVNLLSSDDAIFVQTLDAHFGFRWEIFAQDKDVIEKIKVQFSRGEATESTYDDACAAFASLRTYLQTIQLNNQNARFVALTPSVNLLPIPFNIIAGNFCNDLSTLVVATGDVAASVELSQKVFDIQLPSYFVGLGNPMPKTKNKLKINLGGIGALRSTSQSFQADLLSLPPLPDAVNEIIEISNLFDESRLFLNDEASIADALKTAETLKMDKQNTLINLATHAFAVDYSGDIDLPGMLTAMDDELGVITANEIGIYNLKDSIVLLSACNTAAGSIDRLDLYLSGFVEGFANAGSQLITASLWPVKSKVAKDHSVDFITGLQQGGLSGALVNTDKGPGNHDRAPFVVLYP